MQWRCALHITALLGLLSASASYPELRVHTDGQNRKAWRIKEARVVLGGAVAFTRLAPQASKALTGQPWSEATLKAGLQALAADVESLSPSAGAALALSIHMLVGQPCIP